MTYQSKDYASVTSNIYIRYFQNEPTMYHNDVLYFVKFHNKTIHYDIFHVL